ncbi:MAG: hypothetical protein R2875_16900 [Desulfobacterales bacterium]
MDQSCPAFLSRPDVTEKSVHELVYQAEVAQWVGADGINIHGGGAYGDKPAALKRLAKEIEKLPAAVRTRLTLENDDRILHPGRAPRLSAGILKSL